MFEDFKYTIEHQAGTKMKHINALIVSRYPVILVFTNEVTLKIQKAQHNDSGLVPIFKILESQPYEDYFMESNVLYKSQNGLNLIVVSKV